MRPSDRPVVDPGDAAPPPFAASRWWRAAFAVAVLTSGGLLGVACTLKLSGLGPVRGDSGPVIDSGVPEESSGGGDDGTGDASGDDATSATDSGASSDAGGDAPDAPPAVAPPELAWYKLDETSGPVAHDSSPNHYDVMLQNVAWGMGATFAMPGSGAQSGGSTMVSAGLRQAPVSFTAWLAPAARADEASNTHGILPFPPNAVSGDAPGAFGFGIGLNVWTDGIPGSALSVENVGYSFSNVGGSPFVAGTEYFVAAAIGATSASVYVNAQVVAMAPVTTPGMTMMTKLWLGVHNDDMGYGTKRFYVGRMRDVRVYKRVLTGGEVAALYASGPAP